MALKPNWQLNDIDIAHVSEAAMEKGLLLITKATQPTGRGVGAGQNEAAPVAVAVSGAPASGAKVAGILLVDVVDLDQTRQHRNFQRPEQVVGENISLLTDGWVETNKITGTPAAGDPAYLGTNSTIATTQTNSVPAIGKFQTSKDADGYARVSIKIA